MKEIFLWEKISSPKKRWAGLAGRRCANFFFLSSFSCCWQKKREMQQRFETSNESQTKKKKSFAIIFCWLSLCSFNSQLSCWKLFSCTIDAQQRFPNIARYSAREKMFIEKFLGRHRCRIIFSFLIAGYILKTWTAWRLQLLTGADQGLIVLQQI